MKNSKKFRDQLFFKKKWLWEYKSKQFKGSLLALHHDDVVAKLGLNWWVCVDGVVHRGNWEGKRCILERTNHSTANLPPQVTLSNIRDL